METGVQILIVGNLAMKQLDIHYEGEITPIFIDGLLSEIRSAIHDLENHPRDIAWQAGLDEPISKWEKCKSNWLETLKYAALRCVAIQIKFEHNCQDHRSDEDRRCIDITLCVLRDFESAKLKNFIMEK